MISKNNNGWIKIHRKIYDSELWLMKPISWKIIWIYILGNVNHEPKAGFGRGEGYFNFTIERDLIGKEITKDQIKSFLQYARGARMIDTKRTTRGVRIKVLNYHVYQMDERSPTTLRTTKEPRENHERTTPINKNVRSKEVKNNTSGEKSPQEGKEFNLGEYIKKLEESSRRDLNIIALYLEQRKPDIRNYDQMKVALNRHLRPAKSLVPFTDNQILEAIPKAKKLTEGWTLETLTKVLTK